MINLWLEIKHRLSIDMRLVDEVGDVGVFLACLQDCVGVAMESNRCIPVPRWPTPCIPMGR